MRFFFLIFLLPFALFAQTDVQQVSSTAFTDAQGFVYKLPKTKLLIEVQAECNVNRAGTFHLFAERYLGVKDAITEDSETWTLKSVSVKAQGIPDNDKTYKIMTDNANSIMVVQLTQDGIIAAVNQKKLAEEKPVEIINTATPALNLEFNMSALGQDALLAGSTAKMAETASRQIYSIRENRTDILTGESDNMPTGDAMKVLLAEMDKSERDLRELFVGKTATQNITKTFEFIPEDDVKNEVFFRFSGTKGFTDKDDLSGAPVYLNLKAERKIMEVGKASKKKNGIFYTIPGEAQVDITFGGKTFYKDEFQIGQFGVVQSLAPNLFNKNADNKLVFDTKTGAVTQMLK